MNTAESWPCVSLAKASGAPSGEKRGDQSLNQWSVRKAERRRARAGSAGITAAA